MTPEFKRELYQALAAYVDAIEDSPLDGSTPRRYRVDACRFVRWVIGDYQLGNQPITKDGNDLERLRSLMLDN